MSVRIFLTGLCLLAAAGAPPAPPTSADVRSLIEQDKWGEAVAAAEASSAARPDDPDARAALAEALYRAGRIDEAGSTLEPLLRSEAAPARALAQLGLVRAAQGNDAQATQLLMHAAALAPDDRWVLYRSAGGAPTRARTVELLNAYLARSDGDDPDRIEGARGTIRVYKALGERPVWVPAARPDHAEIPLRPILGPGARGGFVVEATLANKKKARLLLDTGSTGVFVVARAVKKGGYAPLADETVFAGGGEGRTRSARGILPTIAFGDVSFKDALITTTGDEFDPQGRFHGVVGLNVFSGYRVTIDLARGKLILDRGTGEPSGEPYWNVGGQMLVRAAASGGADGLFLLDTGATISNLDESYARTVPGAVPSSAAAVRTYGGMVAGAALLRGVTLRFGGVATRGEPVHASDLTQRSRLGGVQISGFLGMDLLDGTTVVVDTVHQRVAVTHPGKR
jgi:predicted aspartyl protease